MASIHDRMNLGKRKANRSIKGTGRPRINPLTAAIWRVIYD